MWIIHVLQISFKCPFDNETISEAMHIYYLSCAVNNIQEKLPFFIFIKQFRLLTLLI